MSDPPGSRPHPHAEKVGKGSVRKTSRHASTDAPLVEARLRVRVPKSFPWGPFLADHPDLMFEATNRFPVPPRHIVAEARIPGSWNRDWSAELRAIPKVESVQRLDRSGRPEVYRVKWEAPSYYTVLLEKYDLFGVIPIIMLGGRAEVTLAMSRTRLQKVVRELRHRKFEPEVLEIRPIHGRIERGGLTRKQRERFQTAVESGFFDVPRKVTLGELARRFSIRKSALSESLALARRKVLVAAGRAMSNEDAAARLVLLGPA